MLNLIIIFFLLQQQCYYSAYKVCFTLTGSGRGVSIKVFVLEKKQEAYYCGGNFRDKFYNGCAFMNI